ncbi:MAG TPA: hypothetical protein VEX15_12135 [Nocardioidaceae bacterium]|nr:hypothetical protein [Nocardioidaceae bacterium]
MTNDTSSSSHDPALDPRVGTVLTAAAAPAETVGPLPGEYEALAAFRASPRCTKRPSLVSRLVPAKAAVAAAIGTGVLLTGGLGAAATGVLPSAAQETVSTWLGAVGISVPAGHGADGDAEPHGPELTPNEKAERPPPADDGNGKADGNAKADGNGKANHNANGNDRANGSGNSVSETAKNTTAEGEDKGQEIAKDASDGRAQPDDRGSAQPQGGTPTGEDGLPITE